MAETKAAFRLRVGLKLGTVFELTATTGGSTTTAVITELVDEFPNSGDLNEAALYDTVATEWRRVNDWDATTTIVTVSRAFTNSTNSRVFELYILYTPSQIDRAFRQALAEAYPYIAANKVDETLSVADANDYEHTLPAGIRDLNAFLGGSVWSQINDTSEFPFRRVLNWSVRTVDGVRTLVLGALDGLVGKTLRLIGLGNLTFPATDATSIPLNEAELELLATKVCEVIWRPSATEAATDRQFMQDRSQFWGQKYDELKDILGTTIPPGQHIPAPHQRRVTGGDIAENPDAIGG